MCIQWLEIAIIKVFFGCDWQAFKLRLDNYAFSLGISMTKVSFRFVLATVQNYILIKFRLVPIAAIVQSRARWNVYPLKMSMIKICSGAFDRHRRRYNRQYVHEPYQKLRSVMWTSNDTNENRTTSEAGYISAKIRAANVTVSKRKSPKVKPGRDLISGTQITSRMYEFDTGTEFFIIHVERKRNAIRSTN